MSSWLSSTNAKEIGTLYLIFAVFAGMIPKIFIMPAINLAICRENFLKNRIPINTLFKLGNKFYFKVLSAVNKILRDFTQDIFTLFNSLVLSSSVNNDFKYQILADNKTLNTNLSADFINLKKDNSQLGYYLAGLIESDGSIIVPSYHSSAYTPKISIVFNSKDKPLALQLIKTLGYGSIQDCTPSSP